MTNKKNNYNRLAPFYQFISCLVFGDKLINTQIKTFQWIPSKGNILFIGGGDGVVLKKLLLEKPGLKVTYIEKSNKMIDLAISKLSKNELKNVEFICSEIESYSSNKNFDLILSYFFLDQFSEDYRKTIVQKIDQLLHKKGNWIVADFTPYRNSIQWITEKIMFYFLKLCTKIESSKIEKIDKEIQEMGYTRNNFFINSEVNLMGALYQKP